MSVFDYNAGSGWGQPSQNNSYWGASIPKAYSAPNYIAAVNKPMQPLQQHAVTGKYENQLAQMANVTAPNYVDDFSKYYGDLMSKLSDMTQNQQQSTNAGLG